MMKGVSFDNFHTYLDFGLLLSTKTIGSPSAKKSSLSIPGADGVLDLTEYFGAVNYSNRTITFEFKTIDEMSEFLNIYSTVQNAVHGKKMKIVLDDDPYFYYVGRVRVNEWKSDGRIGTIVIDCDCEPYKYKINKTVITETITGSKTVVYNNLRKPVVPIITTDSATAITFGTVTTVINSAGTYTIPEIVFAEGENIVTFNAPEIATVTLEYQEGGL